MIPFTVNGLLSCVPLRVSFGGLVCVGVGVGVGVGLGVGVAALGDGVGVALVDAVVIGAEAGCGWVMLHPAVARATVTATTRRVFGYLTG